MNTDNQSLVFHNGTIILPNRLIENSVAVCRSGHIRTVGMRAQIVALLDEDDSVKEAVRQRILGREQAGPDLGSGEQSEPSGL